MRQYLDDVLIFLGCVLVLIGIYQVLPVATWIAGGLMCIGLGMIIGLEVRK